MKKKHLSLIVIALVFICLLVSCDDKVESYTVTFDSNWGDLIPSVTVIKGNKVSEPKVQTVKGMEFCGWYLDDDLFDFNTPINSNITLEAKWKHVEHIFDEEGVCVICGGGKCGEKAAFSFDEDTGTLRISGSGKMDDYFDPVNEVLISQPWAELLSEGTLKHVVVEEGITSIGQAAFMDKNEKLNSIISVVLPSTLEEIGFSAFCNGSFSEIVIPDGTLFLGGAAFAGCNSLTEITIPSSIIEIEAELFDEAYNVSKVTFLGTEEEWIKFDWGFDVIGYDVYFEKEDKYLLFDYLVLPKI